MANTEVVPPKTTYLNELGFRVPYFWPKWASWPENEEEDYKNNKMNKTYINIFNSDFMWVS